jgi:tetratricopeptide (TPR) repeat protein
MANFMDSRGMVEEFEASFVKPLQELAEKDERAFTDFLARLFGVNTFFDVAPDLVRGVAYDWAGDDDDRWDDLFHAAFGDDDQALEIWDWLAALDPGAGWIDRFDAMLALSGKGSDPMRLRERWLDLGWQAVDELPESDRGDVLAKLGQMISLTPDVANKLKIWDALPEDERGSFFRDSRISELTIAGRWDEAAEIFLEQLRLVEKFKQNPSPMLHAGAAACLRKAGRLDEAAGQDRWVDRLYLGEGAYQIAIGYQFGDDFGRSARWLERAVRNDKPDAAGNYRYALRQHGTDLLEAGRWKEAAAALEVSAQMANQPPDWLPTVIFKLTLRLEADLAHALATLGADRNASLAMLERAYAMAPGDGVLADHFFPAVRKAGLIEQHDAWFKTSWERLSAVADRYPGASNTLNTAAWLGAKAHRNLDAARKYEEQALALKPDESNYLDTMAEIEFAAGNRAKALEWSNRAVDFTAGGISDDGYGSTKESFLLRRQREHFRNDPLPR